MRQQHIESAPLRPPAAPRPVWTPRSLAPFWDHCSVWAWAGLPDTPAYSACKSAAGSGTYRGAVRGPRLRADVTQNLGRHSAARVRARQCRGPRAQMQSTGSRGGGDQAVRLRRGSQAHLNSRVFERLTIRPSASPLFAARRPCSPERTRGSIHAFDERSVLARPTALVTGGQALQQQACPHAATAQLLLYVRCPCAWLAREPPGRPSTACPLHACKR